MHKRIFGKLPTGEEVFLFTLADGDARAEIMTYGATLVSLRPFGDVDVIGGFDSLEPYFTDSSNQGGTIGRVANRIKNACFTLDGKEYRLPANDNGNCLHGGIGFHHKLWTVEAYEENRLTLSYYSPDGDDGFPCGLAVEVTYTLSDGALHIAYTAVPEGKTPIALTNHAYFNLDGFGGDVSRHTLQIWADRYTEVDDALIPNGNRPLVEGTPLDFREMRPLKRDADEIFFDCDHNMILSPTVFKDYQGVSLGLVAQAENDALCMQMYTDQPCLQLYTGNFLGDGPAFKGNIPQIRHGAFCLEAQTEPNCIQHGEAIYDKGQTYRQLTVYQFLKK
ncbi:MAG: galactose mutarotase [Clostridia bacterium]|nr:galactose mutarotase [Clostridia bacterium]